MVNRLNKYAVVTFASVLLISIMLYLLYGKVAKHNYTKKANTEKFLSNIDIREDDFYMDEDYRDMVLERVKNQPKEVKEMKQVTKTVAKQEEKLYYLQVGTFRNKTNAENLLDNLKDLGQFKIEVSPHNKNYYILISSDYIKGELERIQGKVEERYSSLSPVVKVRY